MDTPPRRLPPTPVLYEGEVVHTRLLPFRRAFRHRLYLWLVDLDRLPTLPWWLRPFAGFRAADHLGDPRAPIRRNVADFLSAHGIDLAGGTVLMLTHARVLGHVFNPITLFWCHTADGSPAAVVAEVHNTYGQRHCYLLRPDDRGTDAADKVFYVSSFLTVDGYYVLRLPRPDERLTVSVTLHQQGTVPFAAALHGRRVPAGPAHLVRMLLRHPLMPQRVSLLIRRHGLALWARGLPIVPRTAEDGRSADGASGPSRVGGSAPPQTRHRGSDAESATDRGG